MRYLLSCLVALLLLAMGDCTAKTAPPPAQIDADPNNPVASRQIITSEERERMGLTPHTWPGVLQEDVRPTLDQLSKQTASLKDRLRKGLDEKAYDLLDRIKYDGVVYVEVETKMDAQRRTLAKLKASEFQVRQVFVRLPGFVGDASVAALDKLANNPEVIGVCLDNKPLPGMPPLFLRPKYDLETAFKLTDHVNVVVNLRGDSIPQANDLPSSLVRNQRIVDLQDRVLSTVTADGAWVWGRMRWSTMITLFVTKEALATLQKNPDVVSVDLQRDAGIKFPKLGSQ